MRNQAIIMERRLRCRHRSVQLAGIDEFHAVLSKPNQRSSHEWPRLHELFWSLALQQQPPVNRRVQRALLSRLVSYHIATSDKDLPLMDPLQSLDRLLRSEQHLSNRLADDQPTADLITLAIFHLASLSATQWTLFEPTTQHPLVRWLMQSSLGWSCQSLWSLIACSERGQLLAAFILVEDESGLLPFQLSCRLLEARRQLLNSGNASISQLAWRLYTGLIPIRPEESLADRRAILASCIGGSGAADLIGLLCAAVEALLESAGDTSLLELLRADAETTAEELRRHSTNNGAGLVVAACALLIVLCECDDSRWVNYSLEVLRRIIDALPKHVCALIVVPLLSIIKTPTFDASVATTTTTTAAAAGNSVKQSAELLQLITANLQGEEHGNSISPLSGIFCDRRPFPHLAQHLALLLQPIDIKQHDDVGSLYSLCHHAAGCLLLLNNAMENNIISSIDRLISSQSAINNPLECFEFLCYLLDYSERNSFGAVKDFPELKLHILVDAIPRLIRNTNRDVYLVARVLRLLLPLLDGASEPLLITLRPIALRSLAECCRNYSRLWSNLFAVFYRVIDMREIPELMELMTLKLIRDVCRDQAVEHGEQLLPLINIYLDRKKPKQLQAVVWALQSLVYCVEEEVMDIQAAWQVLFAPLFEQWDPLIASPELFDPVCQFYGLVSVLRQERLLPLTGLPVIDTQQAEAQPPQQILLPPNEQLPPQIRNYALHALGKYPVYQLLPHLGEPRPLIEYLISKSDQLDAVRSLITALIAYEIQHMPRSVFKGTGVAVGGQSSSASAVGDPTSDQALLTSLLKKGRMEAELNLSDYWQLQGTINGIQAPIMPSFRPAYIQSSMYLSRGILAHWRDRQLLQSSQLAYERILSEALKELTVGSETFSTVQLLQSADSWTAFYRSIVPALALDSFRRSRGGGNGSLWSVEKMLTEMICDDLLGKRWADCRSPAMAANLLLASIGLTLAVDSLGLATHASALAAILLEKQIVAILNSIETTGKSQMEELPVQFAHLLGAYLLPRLVVTSDESLVCRLMSACYARLRSIAGRNRQPSVAYTITEISINDFSLGLALGGSLGWLAESAYAELASSSSDAKQPTALGDCIRLFVSSCACIAEEGLACGDDDKCRLPPGVVYGFLLALGNALQQEPLRSSCPLRNPSVLQALVTVRSAAFRFVQNRTISDSNEWKLYYLSGAFRLLAATIDHSLLSPMENSQIIGHQLEAFVSRKRPPAVVPDFRYNCLIALLLMMKSTAGFDRFVASRLAEMAIDSGMPPAARVESLMALGYSIGLRESSQTAASAANPLDFELLNALQVQERQQSGIDNISGNAVLIAIKAIIEGSCLALRRQRPPAENARFTRAAMLTFTRLLVGWHGQLSEMANSLSSDECLALGLSTTVDDDTGGGSRQQQSIAEPADFRRLSPQNSFLRALHERLCEPNALPTTALLLLQSINALECALPTVNWFPLLYSLLNLSGKLPKDPAMRKLILEFVIRNSVRTGSRSLTQFLGSFGMMILLQTDGVGELCSVLKPLLSPLIAAVGRMAADWRTIHRSKWFELMQSLADLLFYRFADMETADLWELQEIFLAELSAERQHEHLQAEAVKIVEGLWLNLAGNCPPSGGRQHYLRIISQMGQLFSRAKPAIINGLFHASGGFIPLYGERLPVIQFKEFALISMIQQQPQRKHQTGDILPKILYNEIICPLIRRLIHADEIELRIKVWLQCAAEAGFISSDGLLKVIDVVLLACSLARPDAEIANEKMTPWVDVLIGQLLGRFCRAIIVSPSSEYIEDDTPSSDDGDSYYLLPYTATATHWLLQCCRQNAELAVQIKKRMWRLFQSQCTQWAVHSAARHTVRSLLICLRGDRRSTDIAEYAKHWLSLFPPEDLFTAHYNSSGKNKRKVF